MNPYYVIRNLLFQTKHIYAGPTRIVSAVVTLNDYKKLTTSQTPILFYYHSDQLGSTGYITDRTGQILEHEEYLPGGESWFEELKNSSANNRLPWQFNGKELDETGLYYYGARYYNPRSGVWMSPDPAFDGTFGSPMGMARYTYARNNPVRFTDPMGLSAKAGAWTPEDSLNSGYGMENDEPASLGMKLSGPGASNAHATPSTSTSVFAGLTGKLTPLPGPPPNWRDDGNPGHQALAQLNGDAPAMRGPILARQPYLDAADTGMKAAGEASIVVATVVVPELLAAAPETLLVAETAPRVYSVAFETQLAETQFGLSRARHFAIANDALAEARTVSPELAELIPAPAGRASAPSGWVWQHATIEQGAGRAGVMQLVPKAQHTARIAILAAPSSFALWGRRLY